MGFSNSLCKSFCWYESFRSFHDVFTLLFGADHLIEIPITEFGHGVCSSEKPQDYIVSCIVFNLFLVSSRIFPYKATTSLECRLKRLCCLLSEWLWLTLKYWWAERPSTVLRCLYGHINVRVVVQAIFTFADPIDWALDGVRRMVQAVWMSTTGKKQEVDWRERWWLNRYCQMFEELCTAYQWKEDRWFEQAEQNDAEHNRKTMEGVPFLSFSRKKYWNT